MVRYRKYLKNNMSRIIDIEGGCVNEEDIGGGQSEYGYGAAG